ncbi:MAG: hypothetical protein H7Z39_17335 [Burkholderiaceae bacterium]|nr:hypothetical protein [Burkholderiaceae bacterium]
MRTQQNRMTESGALANELRAPRWRARIGWMLALACCTQLPAQAGQFNKCTIDGKPAYQDTPCPAEQETVAQGIERKKNIRELERKLDQLQAQGKGMVQRLPPKPVEAPPEPDNNRFVPQPRGSREAIAARISAQHAARTERTNAESAAALTNILDTAKANCGGKLEQYPSVGMSDEYFRKCTIHARFGGITQLVVSEDGNVPLRLYVFPSEQAARVYSIGGVITTIKP